MRTISITLLMSMLTSGCISTINHLGNENDWPYRATCETWDQCVCVWGIEPSETGSLIAMSYVKLTYPFWLVDFPFEVVEDTLFLPWDIWKYNSLKHARGIEGYAPETPLWKKIIPQDQKEPKWSRRGN